MSMPEVRGSSTPASFDCSIETPVGVVGIRDAIHEDADDFLKYWFDSGDSITRYLRIDLDRLGSREETRERFFNMFRTPGVVQPAIMLTLTLNGHRIGYTNVNMHGPDDNYPHIHTYFKTHRSAMDVAIEAAAGRDSRASIAIAVLGLGLSRMFDVYPDECLRRIVLQTRSTTVGINRVLDLIVPISETRHFDEPDGIASPGEFHMRYVHRHEAAKILERVQSIVQGETA